MPDAADYTTEQGELAFTLHKTGQCGELGPCPYCEEDEGRRRSMSTATPLQAALTTINAAMPTFDGDREDSLRLIGAKCRALMRGYDRKWADADYIPIEVEQTCTAPLTNIDTNRNSRTFTLAGKLDVVCMYHDKRILFDHKTTSSDITDPAGAYWDQLTIEAQPSHYMLLKWLNGQKIDGAVWDVVCKPGISPKKLSKAARALAVGNREYCDVRLSDDSLQQLQTTERETLEMYEARLVLDCIKERPDRYFQRRSVPRLDREIIEHAREIWDYGQEILHARNTERHGRNDGACMAYGSPCRFLGICTGRDRTDSGKWCVKKNVHVELPELDGDGRDVLTNSRIGTFKTCRRKHFYQYEMGIERQDEQDRESLLFGHIWHAAQAAWWTSKLEKENRNGNCNEQSAGSELANLGSAASEEAVTG